MDHRLIQIFYELDAENSGTIPSSFLPDIFESLDRDPNDANTLLADIDPDGSGRINIEDLSTLSNMEIFDDSILKPDEKIIRFLEVLEAYRLKCEEDTNYLEAERAHTQLKLLREQEEYRLGESIKYFQYYQKQLIQLSYNLQFHGFQYQWKSYIDEFDLLAKQYLEKLLQEQQKEIDNFQKSQRSALINKVPKYSRELLDCRKREQFLASQKKYAEAISMKNKGDDLEAMELKNILYNTEDIIAHKEKGFRYRLKLQVESFQKRVNSRKRDLLVQFEKDTQRLILRNKNAFHSLETRHNMQLKQQMSQYHEILAPPRYQKPREGKS